MNLRDVHLRPFVDAVIKHGPVYILALAFILVLWSGIKSGLLLRDQPLSADTLVGREERVDAATFSALKDSREREQQRATIPPDPFDDPFSRP